MYFIGIGGIGMSALARYFSGKGIEVYGYDRSASVLTKQLEQEGMTINYSDDIENIPDGIELVVYTPAIPKDHRQLNYFIQNNYKVKKRSEVLQVLSEGKFTIAVSGSHGKTTVTAMIAHILKHSGYGCTAFVGGILTNYNSNYIYQPGKDVLVVEADEFDRSFHRLSPDIAVITAVDSDHLDIYGSKENIEQAYIEFAEKVKPEGTIIAHLGISILEKLPSEKTTTYHLTNRSAGCFTIFHNHESIFKLKGHKTGTSIEYELSISGLYNVENAVAAILVCRQLNIPESSIAESLKSFQGIKRRFEFIIKTDKLVFIDDYAHHPTEITALLSSVRGLFPDKKITVIFQPHLYSRTKDLYLQFAESLDLADEVVLLNIYPAREKPMEGVTSQLILDRLTAKNKNLIAKEELLQFLKERELEVLLTVGAGDIDALVEPIKNELLKSR